MTSGIVLLLTSGLSIIIARWYANALQGNASMGGAISSPKLYWLFYALSAYYVWPLIIGIDFGWNDAFGKWIIIVFACMVFRGIVQTIIMYGTKNWSPWMGISFNVFAFLIAAFGLIKLFLFERLEWAFHPWQILLIILSYCFFIDTYYAWAFWKVVGDDTKGEKPIWFANAKDRRFHLINKVTSINNIILTILYIVLIMSCFYA